MNEQAIVSDSETESIQGLVLSQQQKISTFKTSQINNEVKQEQLQSQISTLKQEFQLELSSQRLSLQQRVDRMRGDIGQWEHKYLLRAPIDGQVSFAGIWAQNQFIRAGEEIFKIVPGKARGGILAKCELPVIGAGKVKQGSKASIRLDAFPYQEYGSIQSQVDKISLVPNANSDGLFTYQLELALPDKLVSTYGRELPFRQQMKGMAIIITEDKRIFHRVFEKLYSVLKN